MKQGLATLYRVYRRVVLFAISLIIAILLTMITICATINDFDVRDVCNEFMFGMSLCYHALLYGLGMDRDEEEAPE